MGRCIGRLLLLSLAIGATPALAVDCPEPSLAASLEAARAAPHPVRLLHGRLDFDPALMPPRMGPSPAVEPPLVPARLEGVAMSVEPGWIAGQLRITLAPLCSGSSCGILSPGGPKLLIAEETPDGLVVEVGPCGGTAFDLPVAGLWPALACFQDGGSACENL